MTSRTQGNEAPLDSAALARFHRLAPEVLRRRDSAYFARELAFGLQFLVIGAVPLVGTARFGWDALSWLAYVVIGAWLGIVTDTLALVFLGGPIRRHARHSAENQFVGLVCDALRREKKTIPRLPDGGVYRPGTGLLFDLVFGTVSTLVIYMVVREEMGVDWGAVTGRPFFALSLAAFVLCQIGLAAWQIAERRGRESEIPVKVFLGGRGAGLFMLMFIVIISADKIAGPQRQLPVALYVTNGFIVLFGLLNTFGMIPVRRENRWLAGYLAQRRAESTD